MYKFLYKIGLSHLLYRVLKPGTLIILSLHRISNELNYFWQPLSPANFELLCSYVSQKYHVITFKEINHCKHIKKPLLILSFDDGYYDFIEYGLPVLKKFSLSANHNLVCDCLQHNSTIWTQRVNILFEYFYKKKLKHADFFFSDNSISLNNSGRNWMSFYTTVFNRLIKMKKAERDNAISFACNKYGIQAGAKMMNWNDAETLKKNNIEIGNHSYSHDVISNLTDPDELNKEIKISKQELEARLQIEVSIFSYPNGQVNRKLEDYFRSAGYKYILEINEKANKLKSLTEIMNIYNRITVGNEPFEKTILRVELFQTYIKKYFK